MASRTMGEERDWARLLKALEDIARNTGRIADALEQPQKEQHAHAVTVDVQLGQLVGGFSTRYLRALAGERFIDPAFRAAVEAELARRGTGPVAGPAAEREEERDR